MNTSRPTVSAPRTSTPLGIGERDAAAHEVVRDPALQRPLRYRELRAIVDAEHLGRRLDHGALDLRAGFGRARDHVGEVVLALRVVVVELREEAPERSRRERHETGVDLVHAPLVVGRVLLLDDARDLAAFVANHAAVAGRVVDDRGQERELAVGRVVDRAGAACARSRAARRRAARAPGGRPGSTAAPGARRARCRAAAIAAPSSGRLIRERGLHGVAAVAVDDVDRGRLERCARQRAHGRGAAGLRAAAAPSADPNASACLGLRRESRH